VPASRVVLKSRLISFYSLSVKGQAGEDAMLCTSDKTFTMRSVILSNSLLMVTPPPDALSTNFSDDGVVIRDQVNEIIELAPSVPKLHKLPTLLRGREYDEGQEDEEEDEENQVSPRRYRTDRN
jgi:sister chromatid cohesion protein DCC1